MIPGMNPRKVQQMMKQMGIAQQEVPATEVIIRSEGKDIIIRNPSVQKVNMMGQENFQISGDVHEQEHDSTPDISQDDVRTVMEQTNVSEQKAREAIQEAQGDLAQAIMNLAQSEE